MDIVTLIKDVQELHTYTLSRLEKGVTCLSTGLNPMVGSSGTPGLFARLRGVNNVLPTSRRLGVLLNHMCLNIPQKNRSFGGIGIVLHITC
jgi:hypothetical protein